MSLLSSQIHIQDQEITLISWGFQNKGCVNEWDGSRVWELGEFFEDPNCIWIQIAPRNMYYHVLYNPNKETHAFERNIFVRNWEDVKLLVESLLVQKSMRERECIK